MPTWSNKKYPHGCRNCGRSNQKHQGLGLCPACYKLAEVVEAARNGTLVEYDFAADLTDELYEINLEPDDDEVTFERPVERRPGSISSPASDQPDASPALDSETVTDRVRGLFGGGRKKKPADDAPSTRERAPKPTGRRHSTADTIEDFYAALGGIAMRSGRHQPLGRFLMWQAPAAGEMLDQAIAGSIVDKKLLQPAVKTRGRLDQVLAVFGPPALILAIESNPERAPQLIPLLKSAIRNSLPTLLPAMKKAQAREEKVNKAVSEMFGDDFPPGVDPVDYVIGEMFAGWYPPQPQENEPATEETANAAPDT